MERQSFVFYRSFYEALKTLPPEDKAKIYEVIIAYGLDGIDPNLEGYLASLFTLIKPQIDANNKKFENGKAGAEHGKKGGRPRKNNPTETPQKPLDNPTETPNANVNANVNAIKTRSNFNFNKKETPPPNDRVLHDRYSRLQIQIRQGKPLLGWEEKFIADYEATPAV